MALSSVLLLCLAAPAAQAEPVGAVVVARAVGLDEAQLTSTAAQIGAAFERAGGAMVPRAETPTLAEAKECRGAPECLCELGRLHKATLVLAVEIAALRESVAVRIDAYAAKTEKRLTRREIATNRGALKSGFLPGLEDVARNAVEAARAAGAVPERPAPPPVAVEAPKPPNAPAPAAPAPAVATSPAVQKPAQVGNGRRAAGYIVGGAGLALIAGGVVSGIHAGSLHEEASGLQTGDKREFDEAWSVTKRWMTIADVLYGAGAVALGTGLYLTLTSPSSSTTVSVGPSAGGAGVMAFGAF